MVFHKSQRMADRIGTQEEEVERYKVKKLGTSSKTSGKGNRKKLGAVYCLKD